MRHIEKGNEPQYLTEHKEGWLQTFLASGKKRPDSKKYAHSKIVDALSRASSCKCFYCESSLITARKEVDHILEVSEPEWRNLAFEWNNLNLSCNKCNGSKKPNKDIPVSKVLDPCRDSDEEIQHCITFDNEVMRSVNNSEKGRLTIEKYNLNSTLQQLQRGKWLGRIKNEILELVKCSGANCLTEKQQEQLRAYTYPSAQYSYMAEIYLKNLLPQIFN